MGNVVEEKSKAFALRVVRLYRYLTQEKREYVLSRQLLRSGTSIGANVKEALHGASKRDFNAKLLIARKEAAETEYWLELLYGGEYLSERQFRSMYVDCGELQRILSAITKTIKDGKED